MRPYPSLREKKFAQTILPRNIGYLGQFPLLQQAGTLLGLPKLKPVKVNFGNKLTGILDLILLSRVQIRYNTNVVGLFLFLE